MRVDDYQKLVRDTEQSANQTVEERKDIMIYGLAGEIGSLLTEIKKQLLDEGHESDAANSNPQLLEELGDIIWYVVALANVEGMSFGADILLENIKNIQNFFSEKNQPLPLLEPILKDGGGAVAKALAESSDAISLSFSTYQEIAALTARTEGNTLRRVCQPWMWRNASELLKYRLPPDEADMLGGMQPRGVANILGDIMWNVAAIASTYEISLEDVVKINARKIEFRYKRGPEYRTPLHDENDLPKERFPRTFDVTFITQRKGKARMYIDGARLGDDLTDNAIEPDGYRFHDVFHLANVAVLGWSPVIRGLMGRKRKSVDEKDDAFDGARARIVEEVIVKLVHAEGCRLAVLRGGKLHGPDRTKLFSDQDKISFSFLKLIGEQVRGLEVSTNKYWEWDEVIRKGYDVFDKLERNGQGTVHADLINRELTFDPRISIDIPGVVLGHGFALFDIGTCADLLGDAREKYCAQHFSEGEIADVKLVRFEERAAQIMAAKIAVLKALGLNCDEEAAWLDIEIRDVASNHPSVGLTGNTRERARSSGVLTFRLSISFIGKLIGASAIALSDPEDR